MGKDSKNLKLTVIIPTKDRGETLQWSLKTCVAQEYDNLEIIVSDNFSRDNTRDVAAAFKDKRVSYINTGRPMSVTGNFEFALAHATGDYVGFIGDDDGYMPGAMQGISDFINDKNAAAVTWKKPVYGWSNLTSGARNTLTLPLKYEAIKYDCFDLLHKLLSFEKGAPLTYSHLPWLYHGFIKTDYLTDLKKINGRFFNSINPDVYAAVALSCVINYFWETNQPYSIPGASARSTSNISEAENLNKFYAENDIDFHPDIKPAFSRFIYTAECFLQVKDLVPEARKFNINIKGLISRAMEDAVYLPAEHYESVVDSVRHLGNIYNFEKEAAKAVAENPNTPISRDIMLDGYNFLTDYLIVKLDEKR